MSGSDAIIIQPTEICMPLQHNMNANHEVHLEMPDETMQTPTQQSPNISVTQEHNLQDDTETQVIQIPLMEHFPVTQQLESWMAKVESAQKMQEPD